MIFKGYKWRKTTKVVILPYTYYNGELKNYIAFGRVCSKDAPNAIETYYTYNENTGVLRNTPVYAKIIPFEGTFRSY